MASVITPILFYAIPILTLVWAIVSVVLFVSANRRRRRDPNDVTERVWRTRRAVMVASLITAGVEVGSLLAVVALFAMAIAYM